MTYIPRRDAIVSTANSTATNLTASGIYTGSGEDVSQYASITLSIFANQPSAINGATIQFSTNNAQWDRVISRSINANQGESFVYPVEAQYFRVVYTNGGVSQSQFRLQSIFHASKNLDAPISIDTPIRPNQIARLNRSIIAGQYGLTDYRNVKVDELGSLYVNIEEPATAYNELITAKRTPTIQLDFSYGINTAVVTPTTTGSGSVSQFDGQAILTTASSASSSATLVSIRSTRSRPGQESGFTCDALFTIGAVGSRQTIGVGTDTDGYAFGYDGATFGALRRSKSVDYWTPQTSWNVDAMDGSGPSGMVLDTTKGNVYNIVIKTGYGGAIYKILDDTTGQLVTVHRENYTNRFTEPDVTLGFYPIRLTSQNTTNSSLITMRVASAGFFLYGEVAINGIKGSASNSKSAVGTTLTNIVTIRNKATYLGAVNHIQVGLLSISAAVEATKPVEVELVFNATLGGTPVWNDFDSQNSVVEIDVAGTTVTGGISPGIIALSKDGSFFKEVTFLSAVIATSRTITMACRATQGNTDVMASLIWQEDI